MLNILSILFGLVAALLALFGLLLFFGWINWLMLPFAFVGLVLGLLSRSNVGRNLNIVVLVVGVVRLSLGGGFF